MNLGRPAEGRLATNRPTESPGAGAAKAGRQFLDMSAKRANRARPARK